MSGRTACEIWTGTQIVTPGAVGSGEGGGPAGREGDRQQPSARRRLRPQARARHGGRGGAHRQAGRRSGEGGVDARGRHPARHLPPGLSRHHRGNAGPTARSRPGSTGSPARRSWRAGCRRRSRRASTSTPSMPPSTCPTTSRTSMSNMSAPSRRRCRPASGAASGRTTTCSRSNASMDELARKAGKDPVEFRRAHARQASRALLAVLNLAAEKANWGQPLPPRVGRGVCVQPSFETLHRDRRGSRGRRTGRGAAAPRHLGGRHRHRRQSRHRRWRSSRAD